MSSCEEHFKCRNQPECVHDQMAREMCEPTPRERKADRIAFLERMKETTKADLLMKYENGDWHGVADAAMDLRDIVSELDGLRY